MEEKTREILREFLEALAGLTAKVLELEEIVNKLKSELYEIKTNEEIISALNKEIEDKGGKKWKRKWMEKNSRNL